MIRKATLNDLDALDALAVKTVQDMQAKAIKQWTDAYPRKAHFKQDMEQEALYVFVHGVRILGAMAFYEENDAPYQSVNWFRKKSMVIHRILVEPNTQKHGIASALMDFAIKYCKASDYESIKIDTHPSNYRMRHFLKKQQFHELEYIKSMHRIGFERIIETTPLNRIIILGASGTGKTTLARMLSAKLNIPHMHLDTVYWSKDWTSISKEAFASHVRAFMVKNHRFVIDGNYTNSVTFMERLKLADTIIILDYPKQVSLKGIHERESRYKHRYRSDMAEGCIEKIDQEFLSYVYNFDDKKHKMIAIANLFKGHKKVYRFKDRESMQRWFDRL